MPRALQRCALTAVAAVALAGTGGCDNPEYTTKYECYFVIDNATRCNASVYDAAPQDAMPLYMMQRHKMQRLPCASPIMNYKL